jgi:hypothetical protein
MKPNVGYLSGTDAATLSQLAASGINTVPLSNGWDNHGKYIGMLTIADNIGLIIGYFHKLVAPPEADTPPATFLERARIHRIPVVVVCPEDCMSQAKQVLGETGAELHWVAPGQVFSKVTELLARKR